MTMSFAHSGNIGDVIMSLPCVYAMAEKYGDGKAAVYLRPNIRAYYYAGAVHPCGNVRMTEDAARSLLPLLQSQKRIAHAGILEEGQAVDVDLDLVRTLPIRYDAGHLGNWYKWAFDCEYDLAQPWIEAEPRCGIQELLVSRTGRYRNPAISYKFLDGWSVLFLGLEEEYLDFRREVPTAQWLPTRDFLEMAQVLAGCMLWCGNQSAIACLAEAMKIPRVLETCPFAPNLEPMGPNGWSFVLQAGFQPLLRHGHRL